MRLLTEKEEMRLYSIYAASRLREINKQIKKYDELAKKFRGPERRFYLTAEKEMGMLKIHVEDLVRTFNETYRRTYGRQQTDGTI